MTRHHYNKQNRFGLKSYIQFLQVLHSCLNLQINYVKEQHLGGVSVFAADMDDFKGLCGEKWPLLTTIHRELTGTYRFVVNDSKLCLNDLSTFFRY